MSSRISSLAPQLYPRKITIAVNRDSMMATVVQDILQNLGIIPFGGVTMKNSLIRDMF